MCNLLTHAHYREEAPTGQELLYYLCQHHDWHSVGYSWNNFCQMNELIVKFWDLQTVISLMTTVCFMVLYSYLSMFTTHLI
jgi:hypothetical protein